MAVSLSQHFMSVVLDLRYEPTLKRIRVQLGADPVAQTDRGMLIWEPLRVVPSYAVPEADVAATLLPAQTPAAQEGSRGVKFGEGGPPLLDPSVPFDVHTADGDRLTVRVGEAEREAAAFRLRDVDVNGYVVLDFDAFDWWEEDERIVGHPRDPFHRIDVRRTSRRIRLEYEGTVLAESDAARLLFEGTFPLARCYFPRADVAVDLVPGHADTTCAYKGHATHWSAAVGGRTLNDIAWSYEDPLSDAVAVKGRVAFYQEKLDVFVDGRLVEKVRTPWS